MILSILLPLIAQAGPSVGVGAGGSLPQAPLEIPRKKAAAAAPVAVLVPLHALRNRFATARTRTS